jgi:hypothetical protein
MKTPLRGLAMATVAVYVLCGCARLSAEDEVQQQEVPLERGPTYTEITASARYVRVDGISSRLKEVGFKADEAKLRAGTVVLRRDNADRLLAELARVTKQDVRSTMEVGLALGQPGRMANGDADDVSGLRETQRMIAGEVIAPKPEALVAFYLFPLEAKDWTLHLDVELAVTTLERFIGYANEADAGLAPDSHLKLVKTPTGFYKPVFATETTKANVRFVSGDVVLLLSANGERLYFLTATARPVKRWTRP